MTPAQIHAAISAVAPIVGVSIPDVGDPATWVISFEPSATAEQRQAAAAAAIEASAKAAAAAQQALFAGAIAAHLDAAARSKGYDGALSIATYVGSSVPQWAAEASAFALWRDQVWSYAYAELAKVQAGQRSPPSVADFLTELPAIAWPA